MPAKIIKKSSLSEQLCDILKDLILNGTYKDGDKLPTEMELTEIYQVSRLTVRSALQRLNALGLVTTKAGDGTYVNKFSVEEILKDITSMVPQPKMLEDVRDFRNLIDLECIRLAIQNSSDYEIEKLKDASDDYGSKIFDASDFTNNIIYEQKIKEIVDTDFKFHMTICELSKNSLYILSYKTAEELIKEFLSTISLTRLKKSIELGNVDLFISSMKSHEALYEAIKARDFKKAKKIFLNHVDYRVLQLPPEEFN